MQCLMLDVAVVVIVVDIIYTFFTLFINMEYNFFNMKFNLNIIVRGYEWENDEEASNVDMNEQFKIKIKTQEGTSW